tara:strand:+ start:103 stop:696 length:594 start_codon:yes stop_codon:yes gene_type:complete
MKILIACEYSGIVRDAFTKKGHDAWSCDILPTESPGNHIQDDILNHLDKNWDMMIAHPPCTHLAVSGARWFSNGHKPISLQIESLEFVRKLMNAPINKIAVENPVSVISTKIKKPTQIIQPFHYGHAVKKTTCLWLKNLPNLIPTKMVEPEMVKNKGYIMSKFHYDTFRLPKAIRGKVRSRFYEGIAEAMAEQWGSI